MADHFDEYSTEGTDEESLSTAELINRDSFEKLKTKRKHHLISARVFTVIISLLLIVILLIVCIFLFFGLKTVEIHGNVRYTSEDIEEKCHLSPKENLVFLSTENIKNRLLDAFPYIDDVTIEKRFPGVLSITVSEQTPVYSTEIEGEWFLLSDNLRVLQCDKNDENIQSLKTSVIPLKLPPVSYAVEGAPVAFFRQSDYPFLTGFLSEMWELNLIEGIDCIDARDRYHIDLYAGGYRYQIKLGECEDLPEKLRFVRRIIDEKCTLTTCAILNAEKSDAIIMQKQNDRFRLD